MPTAGGTASISARGTRHQLPKQRRVIQSLSRLAKALRLSLVLHGSGAQVRLAHAVAQVVRTAHGVFWYENGAAVDLGGEEAL